MRDGVRRRKEDLAIMRQQNTAVADEEYKMPKSAVRHRPTGMNSQNTNGYPVKTPRASRTRGSMHVVSPTTERDVVEKEENDYQAPHTTRSRRPYSTDEVQEERNTRSGSGKVRPLHGQQFQRKRWWHHPVWHHPATWVGGTLAGVIILSLILTVGLAFWSTHFTDPGTYGPMRGQIAYGAFGGGDSQSQPSRIMSTNDNGQVLIIKLTANDPSKATIIPGPNLIKTGFPDPTGANVEVKVGDFNGDGNQDVHITIIGTFYDFPLHRFSRDYTLLGDGNGNLKQSDAA
jgi:hypothetical protein